VRRYVLPSLLMLLVIGIVTYAIADQWNFLTAQVQAATSRMTKIEGKQVQRSSRATPTNWSMFQGDLGHTGYNPNESTITQATAGKLKLKWAVKGVRGVSAQPVVVNGRIFWGSWNGYMHATNLDGSQVWSTFLGSSRGKCRPLTSGIAGSAAVTNVSINGAMTEVVFVGGGDTNFYALNAATGAILWHTSLGATPDNFIWGAPSIYNGNVYIGVASYGDCPLVRGKLMELNASTGAIEHVFYTVAENCLGGGIWDAPTIDTATGMIYFSTGTRANCTPYEAWATALVKVRASDLSFVDAWQVPPASTIPDGDFGSTPTLFQATIGGAARPMVGLINKNGVYYAFDRNNLKAGPLWQARLGTKQVISKVNMSSSAWDGKTLYVASGYTVIRGKVCDGSLRALNPANGAYLWEDCFPEVPFDSVMAVPGLVVVGADAALYVFNSQTGKMVYHYTDVNAKVAVHLYSWGNPCIVNGVLYAGNLAGNFYALGL
jgi:outer membrane protein assembly factor BamB